ncbi:dehydrogenase/reductase SDR family member 11 [Lingula anatina]|uniref:Dehydrogenase/reductase SDR family member 11 n=1 Tax=Lingula anatina TaxID=7574 RepID=A0A1S3JBD5_LINAN|nr:dehydrogenase/reductase SDR family member 11 [Lingula anatina]|eukprot:XP_013407712.1 dehydrogenase/reductase SDR family member 11 [Lingula anatina]
MERWKGRVALVTGASMGIGAAIAGDLVKNGMVVVGCARHVEDIQVNLLAATTVAHLSIKSMKERNVNDGHIINISSSMGHAVLEYGNLHTYSATKHALNAITEGLRHELRKENSTIRTTVICPSLVQTGSTEDFLLEEALQVPEKALQPLDVSAAVMYALSAPPCVNVRHICIAAVLDGYF